MDKHLVEALAFNHARRQRIATQAAARRQVAVGMVEQAPPLTPAMIDTYRLRTQAREEARRNNVQAYLARKRKKLPLPTTGIFACENPDEQVRPRVVRDSA